MKLNLYNVKNIKDDESIGRCDFKDILKTFSLIKEVLLKLNKNLE